MNFQAYTLKNYPEWACLHVKAVTAVTARSPVHLCFVIDTSASMNEDKKLENVKKSIHFLLDFLSADDIISIITFSEVAQVILNRVAVTVTEKENIRARISIIDVESNTNLSAGIVQSRECIISDSGKYKQGILLLTDGIANLGLTRPADIMELVTNTISGDRAGTSISCVGYGIDHNVELLQNISTVGGGSYYVVNNIEDVACVFGDILGGLISCSVQQLRVILPLGTEVKSRYAKNTANGTINIVIGDLPAGMEAVFLAKIPIGTSVSIQGYDLHTHTTFEITTVVVSTDDVTLCVDSEAHYLRFEVLSLLDQSQRILSSFSSKDTIDTHINKINALINKIKDYRVTTPHSLWDVLLEELENCNTSLNTPYNAWLTDTPNILTQHAGYLGLMRGLPGLMRGLPGHTATDESSQLSRGFSNSIQRQISAGLASQVTQRLAVSIDMTTTAPFNPSAAQNEMQAPLRRS